MISVIIPVYNREMYLEECVASVQAQTYENFEIILVDDGSQDSSLDLCKRLAEADQRIRVLSRDHGGVSAARNAALDICKGDFVFFLDSDDVIHPRLLECLVSGLKDSDATIAGTEVVSVPEVDWTKVNDLIATDTGPEITTYRDHLDTLERTFMAYSPLSCVGGVMFKRELIGSTRFSTELYIGEDFYFIYENLIKGAASVFLEQKWYYCRLHQHNSSWDLGYEGFMNRLMRRELAWKQEETLGREKYANTQKRWLLSYYLNLMAFGDIVAPIKYKVIKTMRSYTKTVLPAHNFVDKLRYLLYVYLPCTIKVLYPAERKLRRWIRRKQ